MVDLDRQPAKLSFLLDGGSFAQAGQLIDSLLHKLFRVGPILHANRVEALPFSTNINMFGPSNAPPGAPPSHLIPVIQGLK